MADPALPQGFTVDETPPPGFQVDQPQTDAPPAEQAPSATDGSGFTDEQKRAILAYIPKAKDAADLERFSLELSGGTSRIGNAPAVLAKRADGATDFSWTPPTVDKSMGVKVSPTAADQLRNAIGDGILNSLDTVVPGLGAVLRTHRDAGKAFTEHAANAAAADYGPEGGALIDTLLHPDQYGDFGANLDRNAAHERATMEGDSQGHGAAALAGELTGAGLMGATGGAAADALDLSKAARVTQTIGEGAGYGSGAAGPGDRVEGAATGAALAAATEAAAPLVRKFIAATKSGDVAGAAEAAKAAHDLGIDLPRFVAGSEADAQRANALEQTIGGRKPISDATTKLLQQSEASRGDIAAGLGTAAEPAAMGDQALAAAVSNVKKDRARIGNIYDQAKTAAGGTIFEATQTEKTLQGLVEQESQVLGGTKAGSVLKSLLEDLRQRQGQLTIDGARDTRTELRRRLRDEAGVTPDNADRLTNMVMGSMKSDIESGLIDKGQQAAIPLYRKADAEWARQRSLEDDVLKPFLGRDMNNWGEDVAKKINSDAKGNGTRLAQFLRAIPDEEAGNVRASIISRLGTSRNGVQNAAGDAFSLDQFLTNWNEIKGARNLIFPKDTVQSLDKLAQVAEAAKAAGRTKNRSNTGGVVSYLSSGLLPMVGGAETLMTGDPKGIAVGLLAQGLNGLRQYRAAKLLASPDFARKLAATPLNPKGATEFWSRPWVKAMQLKNPAIAAEIQAFQRAFMTAANDNAGTVASAAAEPEEQNQQ